MPSFTKILLFILATSISGIATLSEATVPFTRDYLYKKVYSTNTSAVLLEAETNSLKKCALLCVQHNESKCSGFYFNSITSTCQLLQGIIHDVNKENPSADPIYRKVTHCPVSLGYKLVPEGITQCCLGAFWRNPLSHPDAMAECKKHGGDLMHLNERYQTLYNLWDKVTDTIQSDTWIRSTSERCLFIKIKVKKSQEYNTMCSYKKMYTCEILL